MIVKCIVPGCKEVGEGVAGRPHTCAKHTQHVVAVVRGLKSGLKSVAQAAVVEGGKQIRKELKTPWWVTAFYDGVRGDRE